MLARAAVLAGVAVLTTSAIVVAQPDDTTASQGNLRAVTQGLAEQGVSYPVREPKRTGPAVDSPPPHPMSAAQRREVKRLAKLRREHLKAKARTAERLARLLQPTSFRVASFNVLGSSHTAGRSGRAGFGSGPSRMGTAVGYLRARGIDVVGFQEFEDPQYAAFTSMAGEYDVWPGRALGPKSIRFSIAWRTDTWSLVEAQSVGLPYAGGGYIQMPYVRLKHTESGREVWFANFHNPADTPRLGRNGRWRSIGRGIQVALANRLRSETQLPVIFTGDFNDREGAFCPITGQTDLAAANGGSTGTACSPPPAMQVDWIFGSEDLTFSNYLADRSAPVPRMTDHPVVQADVYLAPAITSKQARKVREQQRSKFAREVRAQQPLTAPAG